MDIERVLERSTGVEEKFKLLPPDKVAEVVDFVDFLVERERRGKTEASRSRLAELFGHVDNDPAWDCGAARRRDNP